ncbi:hypothetical protein [Stakelama tenebrarum]|uniref:Uncharacterized protein n=1 Tax=Stakelama tenebrarum TaxID=2711215 RepID=A0A6G6Y5C9_9SPHN|nr:hypothetical protein [Sphingosinithalassobacter tenebrarum]QIG80110.1 hypothetical protein G5C33_10180 [Sphingosinithalassobacter tenebrarum]
MKGEIVFDALGKRWTLFLGNAAQCALEEHFDKGYFAIVADAVPLEAMGADMSPEALSDPLAMIKLARQLRQSALREIAWFGMNPQHPELEGPLDISPIIDDVGQGAFGELLGRAIAATQDGGGEGGDKAAPGKPKPRRKPATRARKPTGTA